MSTPQHKDIEKMLTYPGPGKLRVVIDSDTYNEVDDQFAIAWALRSSERMEVEAVYAAPFCSEYFAQKYITGGRPVSSEMMAGLGHYAKTPSEGMQLSYNEILNLFKLLNIRSENKVFRGSTQYISCGDTPLPVESEAAYDLVERASSGTTPLYVLSIGAITNIASAILMKPEIVHNMVVIWLGGQPLTYPRTIEFNLSQDVAAAQIVLNSGVPLVMIPCMGVASHLTTTAEELTARLDGKSAIGSYLTKNVLDCFDDARIPDSDKGMKKLYLAGLDDVPDEIAYQYVPQHISWSRVIWDISVVGYIMSPNWALTTLTSAPILNNDCTWARDNSRHPIRICNYLSRDHIFGDLFAKLTSV